MQIGDMVKARPQTIGADPLYKPAAPLTAGRVVYIHPAGRFCVLEFETRGGGIRESFMLREGAAE